MDITSLLQSGCDSLGIPITLEQLNKFQLYCDFLLEYNKMVNLTAVTQPAEIVEKNFLDSIYPLSQDLIDANARCADVGTGAGFPGVPLAIMRPHLNFTLIDSQKKRLVFLQQLFEIIQIKNCSLVHSRAEDAGRSLRESFDCVLTRAVARMGVLSELCLPLIRPGGTLVCYKGPDVQNELNGCESPLKRLGGAPPKALECTGLKNSHKLIIIRKISHTPPSFPRKAGIPAKNPLF